MTERGTISLEAGTMGDRKPHDQATGQSTEPTGLRSKVVVERLSALAGRVDGLDSMTHWTDNELKALTKDLDQLPELEEYQHENVRTDKLREAITEARRIAAEEKPIAMEKAEVADQLFFEFLADIDKYIRIINSFEQMRRLQQFRMGDREYRELLAKQDHNRHIAHNNLMSSVLPLSRVLNLQFPKTLSQAAADRWEEYIKPRWFTLEQIKNRDFMEKWAVNTDTFEKASVIRARISEIQQSRKERVIEVD